MVAEFEPTPGLELADLWGVAAAPSGNVYVFDAGQQRILQLDPDLRLIRTVGRAGSGPAEFTYQKVGRREWLAVDDSAVFAVDLRAVSEFDLHGNFKRYSTAVPPYSIRVERLTSNSGNLYYYTDLIDRRTGSRKLETWRLSQSGSHALLRTDSMPPLPRWQGRLVRGIFADQAEPLWALHGQCVFISDGAGDWVLRVHLATGQTDTLHIPSREIPTRTQEDERYMRDLRIDAASIGISPGSDQMTPTARLKWNDIVVDPDGFIWLAPWRPRSMMADPLTVWVVNPASGAVDSVTVEEFPRAFLAEGAFVATEYGELDVPFLQKYELSRSPTLGQP